MLIHERVRMVGYRMNWTQTEIRLLSEQGEKEGENQRSIDW